MAMARITHSKALGDQRKAQREDRDGMPSAAYFHDASPHDIVRMWKTGKNANGKKLTDRE